MITSNEYMPIMKDGMIYRLRRYKIKSPYLFRKEYDRFREWLSTQDDSDIRIGTQFITLTKGVNYPNYVYINENCPEVLIILKLTFPNLFDI